jgi:hypothetical protein
MSLIVIGAVPLPIRSLLIALLLGAAPALRPLAAAPTGQAAPVRGTTPVVPEAILRQIAGSGPAKVRDELYADESRWQVVVNGVATGAPAWLMVADRLKPATGAVAEELTRAMAQALEHAPQNVLAILDQSFDADDVCSLNTLEDSLGDDYQAALRTVERRERAVAAVSDPRLSTRRKECLDFLAELRREVIRNRREWFAR